jgi:hypothetical protein
MNKALEQTFNNLTKTVKNPAFYIRLQGIMRNSYWKTLGDEARIQFLVANYLETVYPGVLFAHPPNEGRRSRWEQYLAVYSGMRAGMPDIMVYAKNISKIKKPYLAIELKAGKNKPTKNQVNAMKQLEASGWECYVCYTFEEAKELIDNHLIK